MSSLTLTANSTTEERDAFVAKLLSDSAEILAKNPDNRCCKYISDFLKSEEGKELSNDGKRQYSVIIYRSIICFENPLQAHAFSLTASFFPFLIVFVL